MKTQCYIRIHTHTHITKWCSPSFSWPAAWGTRRRGSPRQTQSSVPFASAPNIRGTWQHRSPWPLPGLVGRWWARVSCLEASHSSLCLRADRAWCLPGWWACWDSDARPRGTTVNTQWYTRLDKPVSCNILHLNSLVGVNHYDIRSNHVLYTFLEGHTCSNKMGPKGLRSSKFTGCATKASHSQGYNTE